MYVCIMRCMCNSHTLVVEEWEFDIQNIVDIYIHKYVHDENTDIKQVAKCDKELTQAVEEGELHT